MEEFMRKVIAVSAVVFTFAAVLLVQWFVVNAGSERGQQLIEKYIDRGNHDAEKVKLHLAIKLITGKWNDQQQAIIIRAFNNRNDVSEAEISAAFSHDDVGAVFYNPGSVDIKDLRIVYNMPIGKSEIVRDWTPERKHRLWQLNAALSLVRYDLTPAAQQFVIEFGQAIPTITRENAPEWDQRAAAVLPRQIGRGILTTIGDDRCPGQFASLGKPKMLPQCNCTTKAGNWSCNDRCQGEGNCNVVLGDCGILWLYDCNGMCNNSDQAMTEESSH
jgi:hypothetical protein